MNFVKKMFVNQALSLLAAILSPDLIRDLVNKVINWVEAAVAGTASTVDDKLVFPILEQLRDALNIPDTDDVGRAVPIKNAFLAAAMQQLVAILNPDTLKGFLDTVFDHIENFVLGTNSTIDDALVLPVMKTLRIALDIPDND